MWDTLIIRPIINLMLIFYKFLGHETIIAVAVITALFRLAMAPMMLKQQKTARKQMEIRPKLEEIQEKYKDDPEKLMQEQTRMYRELGVNPFGGCLMLVIQLPVLFGVYQAIIRSLAATPLQLLALPQDIYDWIPGLNSLIPLKSHFLWLDLALPDPLYILPILVFATSYFYQKMITPPASSPEAETMNKQMTIMMPIFIGFISLSYASGIAVYFLISNLVGILQYYLFRDQYQALRTPVKKEVVTKKKKRSSTAG